MAGRKHIRAAGQGAAKWQGRGSWLLRRGATVDGMARGQGPASCRPTAQPRRRDTVLARRLHQDACVALTQLRSATTQPLCGHRRGARRSSTRATARSTQARRSTGQPGQTVGRTTAPRQTRTARRSCTAQPTATSSSPIAVSRRPAMPWQDRASSKLSGHWARQRRPDTTRRIVGNVGAKAGEVEQGQNKTEGTTGKHMSGRRLGSGGKEKRATGRGQSHGEGSTFLRQRINASRFRSFLDS
ncbi:hypothetical protein TRVL_04442 [Trypanosoma vivax]|nr:hypothetical protein TRVL_04442 [Trypanosoma vivax]